jgi:hypothetical protein
MGATPELVQQPNMSTLLVLLALSIAVLVTYVAVAK